LSEYGTRIKQANYVILPEGINLPAANSGTGGDAESSPELYGERAKTLEMPAVLLREYVEAVASAKKILSVATEAPATEQDELVATSTVGGTEFVQSMRRCFGMSAILQGVCGNVEDSAKLETIAFLRFNLSTTL